MLENAECRKKSIVKRVAPLLCLVASLTRFSSMSLAQGGPPFRSDDPDTPGNRHWEINTVLVGDRNPSLGLYSVPNIDVNYGLGNRIQLKFELPLAIEESRGPSGHVVAGLGNSLLGVKWRFYAHHPKSEESGQIDKKEANFGISTYPQLLLNNPTSSKRRDPLIAPSPDSLDVPRSPPRAPSSGVGPAARFLR